MDVDEAVGDRPVDVDPLVLAQIDDVGRRHALDDLHVARQQRGDPRRVLRQQAQRDLLPRRLAAPPGVVARELDPVALGVAHELVRSGADRGLAGIEVLGRCLGGGLGYDRDLCHVRRHQRIRRRRLEADRVRVDDDHFLDLLAVRGERRRTVRDGRHAFDRRDDVRGGEIAAVVEFHALAQLELPRQRIHGLPFGGQRRLELRLLVALDQEAEDVRGDVVVGRDVVIMRIEGRDVGGKADRQIRRQCARGNQEREYNQPGKAETTHRGTLQI